MDTPKLKGIAADIYAALELDGMAIGNETLDRVFGKDVPFSDLLTLDDLRMIATVIARLSAMASMQATTYPQLVGRTIDVTAGLKGMLMGFMEAKGLI